MLLGKLVEIDQVKNKSDTGMVNAIWHIPEFVCNISEEQNVEEIKESFLLESDVKKGKRYQYCIQYVN